MTNTTSSIAIAILSLTSFACHKTPSEAQDSNSLSAKGTPASLGADKVTACIGNEPFWNLKIDKNEIQFESLGGEEKMTMVNHGPKAARGSLIEYISLYQGRTLENESQYMNVIIQQGKCSDFMSDTIYPFSVAVLSGSTLYRGCCR